ncbi:hypothetical protein OG21DRAFT_1382174, partial [Imleria badia]
YHRARDLLVKLEASKEILNKYQVITPKDLEVPKDITEENQFGQSSDVLPWFWRVGVNNNSPSSLSWDQEGMSHKFYLILWLKAKARYDQWGEEMRMVTNEMLWTTLWFQHRERVWENRWVEAVEVGHKAYAAKQRSVWERFRLRVQEKFNNLSG